MVRKPVPVFATLDPPELLCSRVYGFEVHCQYEDCPSFDDCDKWVDSRPRFQMVAPSYKAASMACLSFIRECRALGLSMDGYVFDVSRTDES